MPNVKMSSPEATKNTILTFGMHKGYTVQEVMDRGDYSWLWWAHLTVEWFSLEDELAYEVEARAAVRQVGEYQLDMIESFVFGNGPWDI